MSTPTEAAIKQLIEWRDHGSGPDANYCAGNQRFADDVTLALGEIERMKKSHARLLKAAKLGASALDAMMGDSDLEDDDSPEFKACQALNRAIDFATSKPSR